MGPHDGRKGVHFGPNFLEMFHLEPQRAPRTLIDHLNILMKALETLGIDLTTNVGIDENVIVVDLLHELPYKAGFPGPVPEPSRAALNDVLVQSHAFSGRTLVQNVNAVEEERVLGFLQ